LIALEEIPERLHEDHSKAKLLAERLAEMPGIAIDAASVQTNIVIFGIEALGVTTAEFSEELKRRGTLANGIDRYHMRFVTHLDVTMAQCENAAEIAAEVSRASSLR
jgi:threonine aldolase